MIERSDVIYTDNDTTTNNDTSFHKKFWITIQKLLKKTYIRFFLTGASGVALNLFTTGVLTEFVFGRDRYFIGYIIGTLVNLVYNFTLYSTTTFKTRRGHLVRFAWFIVYSMTNWSAQTVAVVTLVSFFGTTYYLPIIAITILLSAIISFLFFQHVLFNEQTSMQTVLRRWWERFPKTDAPLIVLILCCAFLLRFPNLETPNLTMFDELLYQNFIILTVEHQPYFDIHPPVARLLMSTVAKQFDFDNKRTGVELMQPYGNFPYVPLRRTIALLGTLLPLVVYGIARLLDYSPRQALIPALLICFDNALIIYSRVILPDTILLLFSFTGIFFALLAGKRQGKVFLLYVFLAGLFFGLAVGVKWTALGAIVVGLIIFLKKRMWGALVATIIIIPIVYTFSFLLYFQHFPNGGYMDPVAKTYNVPWITNVKIPPATNVYESLHFLPTLNKIMLEANTDEQTRRGVMHGASPWQWIFMQGGAIFWKDDTSGKSISLVGNIFLWLFSFLVLCYSVGFALTQLLRTKTWVLDGVETLILLGYFICFIPFFFITRSMYLYHYFTPLIFLFLLLPKVVPRLQYHLGILFKNTRIPKQLLVVCIILCVINFLIFLPITYGFSF